MVTWSTGKSGICLSLSLYVYITLQPQGLCLFINIGFGKLPILCFIQLATEFFVILFIVGLLSLYTLCIVWCFRIIKVISKGSPVTGPVWPRRFQEV